MGTRFWISVSLIIQVWSNSFVCFESQKKNNRFFPPRLSGEREREGEIGDPFFVFKLSSLFCRLAPNDDVFLVFLSLGDVVSGFAAFVVLTIYNVKKRWTFHDIYFGER